MNALHIKQVLRERVAELAPYLYPNGHPEGVHWCVGSINGEPGKSFKICIAGPKAGLSGDFAEPGKHSRSLLDLWMQARNVDFKTALHEAAEWLGQPLHREAQSASTTKSPPTFPILDDAIRSVQRTLKMLVTRRDVYHDREGNKFFVIVRFDSANGKQFRPFHRNSSGWIMKDPPGKLPLFRLPLLIARPGERVFIVEGEKCACELATLGLLVTTSAHGAKSPQKTDWQPLAGREVVILPDNNAEGRDYAQAVAGILLQQSPPAVVRSVELPGLPQKGDFVDWLEAQDAQTPEDITAELLAMVAAAPVLAPEKPKAAIAPLLDSICAFVRRYNVFQMLEQAWAIALWVAHCWVVEAFDFTPYLHINSPEKQCAKTRLLDCLALLVVKAWRAILPSEPVLFRTIESDKPTLLLDEADGIFTSNEKDERREALRSLLNAGFERGAHVPRCVGQGTNQEVRNFAVFCPKAIAGIGKLPDTVRDRSVPIQLVGGRVRKK